MLQGTVNAVFSVYADEPDFFDDEEIRLLEEIGGDISFALDRFEAETLQNRAEEALLISEERFRSLYENSTVGMYRTTPDGHILMANPAAVKMLGFGSLDELKKRNLEHEGYEPDYSREQFRTQIEQNGFVHGLESAWKKKDGSTINVRESAKVVYGENGNVLYYDGTFEDITKWKQAEEALKHSEAENRAILNAVPDLLFRIQKDGTIVDFRAPSIDKLYVSPEMFLGKRINEVLPPQIAVPAYAAIEKSLQTKEVVLFEYELPMNGEIRSYEDRIVALNDNEALSIIRDITTRKRAETALKESEFLFKESQRVAFIGSYKTDFVKGFWESSEVLDSIFGIEQDYNRTVQGWLDIVHPDDREMMNQYLLQEVIAKQQRFDKEYRIIRKNDRQECWVHGLGDVTFDEQGNILSMIGTIQDITERITYEDELLKLRKAVETSGEIIFMTDQQGTFTYINPAFTTLYGFLPEEVIGKETPRILKSGKIASEGYKQFWDTLLNKTIFKGELINKTKEGKFVTIEASVNPILDEQRSIIGFLAIQEDITERKQLQEQYYRAQRMESLGTLASGIAHDLNNMLTPILLATELLGHKFRDEASQSLIATLESSAKRGKGIIQQILTFARGSQGERGIIQLKHIVREMEKIVNETFPKTVRCHADVQRELLPISGDATQIHQVLMNLCVNARDAMQNGGALLIKAENRSVDEEFARVHLDAKPGYYTTITVTDTGIGMSQEVLDKIFEPFFTTKEQGKGTGLGLSTVHSIVKNHGGFITVNSSINKGTSFTLFFPSIESPELMVDEQSKKDTPRGNGEHILVVDDEVLVRDIAKQTLELYGYTVTEAIDGTEAVAKYATQRSTIKIVLTDINMPVMDGYATIRALRKINPDVKIIAASGLAADFEILESTVGKIQAFIQKPYPPLSLLELLHEVLSQ